MTTSRDNASQAAQETLKSNAAKQHLQTNSDFRAVQALELPILPSAEARSQKCFTPFCVGMLAARVAVKIIKPKDTGAKALRLA